MPDLSYQINSNNLPVSDVLYRAPWRPSPLYLSLRLSHRVGGRETRGEDASLIVAAVVG